MTPEDTPFQLTDLWFDLGVVTPEQLTALRAEWERGDDANPEHYRWRAFVELLRDKRPLSAAMAGALSL